jgi:DNA polymerase-3 subunit gamma/tau
MNNYIVSARKYRPATFHSVVGQKSLTTTLKNAILNNKLAHAYLFCGPRGVGKTTCARIFAKTINCFHPTADGEACNECESCRSFNENRSLNIHELDAASNNSVDDIRALTEQVRILPQLGRYKVYIIDEVHMLSASAFNAFLKTLEEPPKHAIFILATTEKHKILPTILSRCQIYDFSRINIKDITDYLSYVAKQENVSFEPEALNVIAQKADGGMRDALSIFDQVVSFSQGNVTYKTVIENLNVLDYDYYFRITEALIQNDVAASVLLLNEILSKGFDGQHILSGLALFFRDLLVCRDAKTIVLFESGEEVKKKYLALAEKCSQIFLYKAMELTNETDLNYRLNKNKRFALELLLIRLCQLNSPTATDGDKKKIVIEPIVTVKTEKKEDKTIIKPETQQQQQQQQQQPKPKPETPEPPKTTSLSSILNGNSASVKDKLEAGANSDRGKQQNNIFSQDDLQTAWSQLATKLTDAYLKNAVQYVSPVLKDGFVIEIAVLNPEQESFFQTESGEIIRLLKSSLQNDMISLTTTMAKKDARKAAVFTDREILQQMLDKNPDLLNLIKELKLRLE